MVARHSAFEVVVDKLRALQYFLAAAETGSLSAAARQQGVTLQAVAKSIDGLEHALGFTLFQRSSRGLTLTPDGVDYADTCRPLLGQMQAAEETLRGARSRPQGTLVVGGTNFFVQHCLLPVLPQFVARFPGLSIDMRNVMHLDEPAASDCEVLVLHGWFDAAQWVRRELPFLPNVTLAAPAYWAKHGLPSHPRDLQRHNCLCYRNPYGKLLDLWRYQRGESIEEVVVKGWLHSNHRDHLHDLAAAGEGVIHASPAVARARIENGLLAPALEDWTVLDLPPLAIYMRPEQRLSARVRAFVDFTAACCKAFLDEGSVQADVIDRRPNWHSSPGHRASQWLTRNRR